MDLKSARIVLRPRKPSEIFDLALRYCFAADPKLYLWLCVTMLLPFWGACLGLRYGLGLDWGWVWAVAYAATQVVQGPFSVAAGRLMFEPKLTVRDVLRHFRERLWSFFGATMMRVSLVGLGALCLFVPAFFVANRLLYVNEAVLLERASGAESLKRSNRFVQGYGSHGVPMVFGLALAVVLCVLTFETLGQGLTTFVLQVGEPFGTFVDNGGSPFALLGFFLAVPYLSTARFLAYVDQRTRQDGWDVQVKFMALQAEAPEAHRAAAAAVASGQRPGGRAA